MRENADLKELSSRQRRVAELLAAGKTRAEAAKQAGVGERTVYVWLRDERFRGCLKAEEARLRGELTSVLRRSVMRAVAVLEDALDSDDEDRKLTAARALLSAGVRLLALMELSDLGERVSKLEDALGGIHGNGKFFAAN